MDILDDHKSLRKGPPRSLSFFTKVQLLLGNAYIQGGFFFFWMASSQFIFLKSNDFIGYENLFLSIITFVLILFFWLIALLVILFNFKINKELIQLMEHGEFTTGKLITPDKPNRPRQYSFEFFVDGKRHLTSCSTDQEAIIKDETLEKILYDPSDITNNCVYDTNNICLEFDTDGHFIQVSIGETLYFLFVPILGFIITAFLLIQSLM